MSDKSKENLSALMDGELQPQSARETIDGLLDNQALRVSWSRYHLVRDVLRHKIYPDAGDELRERMRGVLADEPVHFPRILREVPRWRTALRPLAGVALAASVAAVAVLGVRSMGPPETTPELAAVPAERVAAGGPASPGRSAAAIPASAPLVQGQSPPAALQRLQWSTSEPAVAQRLNGYFLNHSEYLGGAMKGMHPYARIVGYDSTGQR
ncbi:MAG: hypothetical protein GTO67_04355 [Gammaproteobacteria bacterium]|nr:hypothetical protein [Gammaproteobacteria bacterium]NIM71824.1 hypothetical protein [Gammaproteobacteria bacterium]NIN37946.1 hypothetical protein [Gammaproteobacteria bacterium]NIO23580.1 hypothetical protein [Gammaproteobacteria bacterium]NIO64196.1 hypothetical protein [Gammaproteobacteria bacterium]